MNHLMDNIGHTQLGAEKPMPAVEIPLQMQVIGGELNRLYDVIDTLHKRLDSVCSAEQDVNEIDSKPPTPQTDHGRQLHTFAHDIRYATHRIGILLRRLEL
jgi:hypothetical protein